MRIHALDNEQQFEYLSRKIDSVNNMNAFITGLQVLAKHLRDGLATRVFVSGVRDGALVLEVSEFEIEQSSYSGRILRKLGFNVDDLGYWVWPIGD